MSEHHEFSPSAADRIFACPGSLRKSRGLPDEVSEFSSEGTAAHAVRENCLRNNLDVEDYLGEKIEADGLFFEVTQEWVKYLQPGIDRIREAKGYQWSIEHRTEMDPWIPGGFGTLDAGGVSKDRIIIDDLKFGRWIEISAERNKQLMIYALGFWKNYARELTDATEFLIRIDQPRVPSAGDEWEVSLEELLEFSVELEEAYKRSQDPNAPLTPGLEQCRFCPAARNGVCEALDAFVLDLLGLTPDRLDADLEEKLEMKETELITPERRSYVLKHVSMVNSWVTALRKNALKDAMDGAEVPGFKAVATYGDRSWKDPEAAEEYWRSKLPLRDVFNRTLKSPAQIERVAGTRNWNNAQDLIHRPEGPPALVPESDKRPALMPLMELLDDLDDLEDYLDESLDDLIASSETTETTETTDNCPLDELI